MQIPIHKENSIPILAGFFILLTLAIFIWSMKEIVSRVSISLEPPTGGTAAAHFNIKEASQIEYRGNLKSQ